MYCSTCGVAVGPGLSYCNYCGAKVSELSGDKSTNSPEVKPELLVSAMVAVFVLGLGAITGLIAVMKAVLELNAGQILAFTMLSFLIMLLIEGVCIRLLFRRSRATEGTSSAALLNKQTTKELNEAQPRLLREPVPSVTEHTTRAFDPIYNERTSK